MCGEHGGWSFAQREGVGSSPRVRGTLRASASRLCRHGIIPACAGNTLEPRTRQGTCGDHPRVCGEHLVNGREQLVLMGSSPRVRGTRDKDFPAAARSGIIPACAGNTLENTSSKSRKRKAKLHFNQFAEEMQRCLTVRFCAMGSFVVKVQQVKHGFQTIVWRLW